MNKTAIKTFAVWARKRLIDDIRAKAGLVGITEKGISKPLPSSTGQIQYFNIGTEAPYALTGNDIRSREKLVTAMEREMEQSDYTTVYQNLLENTASAWFNRLIAIRFMEINDYFSDHLRILSSVEQGKQDPDLATSPFDSDLEFKETERQQIIEWKMNHEDDALFQFLFIKKCNELHRVLPGLFEDENDDTEFLMNLSFIEKDGVVYHLIHDIPEEDWLDQVQIIGWIYQYYNSEVKDETFALLKKNVKITKERIPSATQLFTPDWIVRYMVENSLGRLWLEGHPDEKLRKEWKYYLDEAEQEPEVLTQLEEIRREYRKLSPEEIKFIDPCMGSGHILVYAFDVLMQIYESCGYTQRDAARLIVEKNLYGLDIDDRAYQLAYFAVMMKARQYNRRVLKDGMKPHVYSIQESNLVNRNHLKLFGAGLSDKEREDALGQMEGLLDTFRDAKEYGSILIVEEYDWELLRRFVADKGEMAQISLESFGLEETAERLRVMVEIGEVMEEKYEVVVTNPPYMGISNGDGKLNNYVKKHYPDSKADLFAVFIERCGQLTKKNGYQAMITQHAWMFLSSFEKLREKLLQEVSIVNMAHLGARAFEEIGGEVVQTTSFVLRISDLKDIKGTYCRLVEPNTQYEKEKLFLSKSQKYTIQQNKFGRISGNPIAYWASDTILAAFNSKILYDIARPRQGLATTNNERFLRYWFEVKIEKIGFNLKNLKNAIDSNKKWFPITKGGSFRRWYGNFDYVVNFERGGKAICNYIDNTPGVKVKSNGRVINRDLYFQEGLTWSTIASGLFSMRYIPNGSIFETKGSMCFTSKDDLLYLLGLYNSIVMQAFLAVVSPTLDYHEGPLGKTPVIVNKTNQIDDLVSNCIEVSRCDWDSFEISWDFNRHPLIGLQILKTVDNWKNISILKLRDVYQTWEQECDSRFSQLKSNEEELNRIFIEIYGLQDELTPEVEDKDITVRKADLQRDIRSLISYAVGCMFGRYSLEIPGLVYAGGEWPPLDKAVEARKNHPEVDPDVCSWTDAYGPFIPDLDNCIPILDSDYLPDDIVGRFIDFIQIVYGEESLEENLDFIASALGGRGTTSREVIRNYFLKDFYKDHLKIYQKRPIYWLFDSGKQDGFKALIYMHRYNEDTIGRVRADYLHKVQERYENEVRAIDAMQEHILDPRQRAAGEKRKEKLFKQIKETKEYDERIGHLALERIAIDLDDGVKVNYGKVQTDRNGDTYQILWRI